MARRKQTKAEVLAGLETRRIAQAAARAEAARLTATGAEARVVEERQADGRTRPVVRARRVDVFQLLLERNALPQASFDAVREYETDIATASGWNTPERRPDHIRASTEGAPGQNVSQLMIEASRAVAWVRDAMTARDFALLSALLEDGRPAYWRVTAKRLTGEVRDECQVAAVRAMAANLADVRSRYQREYRKAA